MNYIAGATPNGKDFSGDAITGYKWWNFAYPTVLMDGSDAVNEFVAATGGSVNFGGTVGAVPSYGVSFSTWADPANQGWLGGLCEHPHTVAAAARQCRGRPRR